MTGPVPGKGDLDSASGAPLHPAAREVLLAALDRGYADPRRLHRAGREARLLLDNAREATAAALGVRADEVTFTPSGTHAVHLGLLGLVRGSRRGRRVVHPAVEHSAVRQAVAWGAEGDDQVVRVDRTGRVDAAGLVADAGSPDVGVVALQTANHEVGTVQPVGSGSRPIEAQASVKRGTSFGSSKSPTSWTVPTSWLAVCSATTPTSGATAPWTRSPSYTRPSPITPTSSDRAPQATACRTAECSTAEWTTTSPLREPRTSPRRPRCTAWVPLGVKVTSSGRTPSACAVASRALSSRSRASRPARCSRRGSAYPRSRAASSTSRAAGWSGSAEALSRSPGPVGGAVTVATYATHGRVPPQIARHPTLPSSTAPVGDSL